MDCRVQAVGCRLHDVGCWVLGVGLRGGGVLAGAKLVELLQFREGRLHLRDTPECEGRVLDGPASGGKGSNGRAHPGPGPHTEALLLHASEEVLESKHPHAPTGVSRL